MVLNTEITHVDFWFCFGKKENKFQDNKQKFLQMGLTFYYTYECYYGHAHYCSTDWVRVDMLLFYTCLGSLTNIFSKALHN